MSDSLITRAKRLISASANSFIENWENANPEAMMAESIRELDDALDDVREAIVAAVTSGVHARKRISLTRDKIEDLNEKACLAIAQGRDDLARAAMSRQLEIEGQLDGFHQSVVEANAKHKELDGLLASLQARKTEMEAELQAFVAIRDETASGDPFAQPARTLKSRVERRAESAVRAFDKSMSKATGQDQLAISKRETFSKLSELDQMAHDKRLDERLASLKALRHPA